MLDPFGESDCPAESHDSERLPGWRPGIFLGASGALAVGTGGQALDGVDRTGGVIPFLTEPEGHKINR